MLGLFKVTKRCSDQVFKIFDVESGKRKRVHFNLLEAANRNIARDNLGHNAAAGETEKEDYRRSFVYQQSADSA